MLPLARMIPFFLALWFSADVSAARVAPQGKVRVHLDTEFFGWAHSRPYYEPGAVKDPANPRVNTIGFGFGRPLHGEASDLGGVGTPSNTMIALGVGYILGKITS